MKINKTNELIESANCKKAQCGDNNKDEALLSHDINISLPVDASGAAVGFLGGTANASNGTNESCESEETKVESCGNKDEALELLPVLATAAAGAAAGAIGSEIMGEACNEEINEGIDLTNIDLASLDRAELIKLIRDNADATTKAEADEEELEDAAEDVADGFFKAEDLIDRIEGEIISQNTLEDGLQMALTAALRERRAGYDADYPNVLLSGLAGFGKTAGVKEFCKKHHLNLFECDAKTLDIATVSGIPYPTKDKNGILKQLPVASSYWDNLFRPNTVLFLDEYNRAAPNIAGTLLGLINNHDLPMSKTSKNGKVTSMYHFDNILFTVIAINPASEFFNDVNEMTPEKISRTAVIWDVEPDKKVLKSHLDRIYKEILSNPYLPKEDLAAYEGQQNIYTALLTDRNFKFDLTDDVADIHSKNQEGHGTTNFLNYRTFLTNLLMCDGTKLNYLKNLRYIKWSDTKTRMIQNILASYTDKPCKANTVFSKAQAQAAATATAAQKATASAGVRGKLGAFAKSLGN